MSLLKNISFLYVAQAANVLFPLLSVPYLVRVLGIEAYGQTALLLACGVIGAVIVDFGFDLTATQQAAKKARSKGSLVDLYCAVTAAKVLIATLLVGAVAAWVAAFDATQRIGIGLFAASVAPIGAIVFPLWLLQGLQRMRLVAVSTVAARALCLLLLVVTVSAPSDVYLATAIQAAPALVAGAIVLIYLALKRPNTRLTRPSRHAVKELLLGGLPIALSNLCMAVVSSSGVLLVGVLIGGVAVGQYALADRIVKAVVSLQVPVVLSLFPRLAAEFSEDPKLALKTLRAVVTRVAPFLLGVAAVLFLLADVIVWIVAGRQEHSAAAAVRVLSILPIVVFARNVFGTQILINLSGSAMHLRASVIVASCIPILSLILIPPLGSVGAALVYVSGESLLTLLFAYCARRRVLALRHGI